ncbi:hypothetical protein C0033_21570 [Clostridium sp. chh4-2]|uniref:alpha/beta hydrolase n=1 Tax=Clostridium sp. chh4-2 TaxID=2067550 RepID=UPI000CCEF3DF|nr:alpha/beta hydrolase [Clostridium sp. chh4-2]PNV59871.1 hypothetical protein C0033_21570 [Clostridium sp. chh4-2]
MKYYINPERRKPTINFVDHIVYSKVNDLERNPLNLELSIMSASGNSELKAAMADAKETDKVGIQPVIIWISGGGYRGVDKNQMIAEIEYLAESGYAVIPVYYRSSAQGHWPDQLIDVKTAIRFLRAHAKEYQLDPDRIGIMGRSAGGHLAAMAALNLDGYDTEEWKGYSSKVQAAYDMFGPVDVVQLMKHDRVQMENDPNYRWKTVEETHAGALMGGDPDTMLERAKDASAVYRLEEAADMAPMLIMHGDSDWLVPPSISIEFYQKLVETGREDKVELYLLKGAGHGTPEFFQYQTKEIVTNFFDKYLL